MYILIHKWFIFLLRMLLPPPLGNNEYLQPISFCGELISPGKKKKCKVKVEVRVKTVLHMELTTRAWLHCVWGRLLKVKMLIMTELQSDWLAAVVTVTSCQGKQADVITRRCTHTPGATGFVLTLDCWWLKAERVGFSWIKCIESYRDNPSKSSLMSH